MSISAITIYVFMFLFSAPGNNANSGKNTALDNLPIDPWWLALIGLIVLLFIIFIIIVVCTQCYNSSSDDSKYYRA